MTVDAHPCKRSKRPHLLPAIVEQLKQNDVVGVGVGIVILPQPRPDRQETKEAEDEHNNGDSNGPEDGPFDQGAAAVARPAALPEALAAQACTRGCQPISVSFPFLAVQARQRKMMSECGHRWGEGEGRWGSS